MLRVIDMLLLAERRLSSGLPSGWLRGRRLSSGHLIDRSVHGNGLELGHVLLVWRPGLSDLCIALL